MNAAMQRMRARVYRSCDRPEAIEAGVARSVGTQCTCITTEAEQLFRDPIAHGAMAAGANPYGDGKAAGRIVSILLERSRV